MNTAEMLFETELCLINSVELGRMVGVSLRKICNWRKDPDVNTWKILKLIIRIWALTVENSG